MLKGSKKKKEKQKMKERERRDDFPSLQPLQNGGNQTERNRGWEKEEILIEIIGEGRESEREKNGILFVVHRHKHDNERC